MAYEESLVKVSMESDSSIASYTGVPGLIGSAAPNWGKQFRFVKIVSAKTVGLSTNAENELTMGVLQSKPQVVGEAATVAIHGISFLQSGAAITAGEALKSDGSGRGTTATVGTDVVLAIAIAACAAADQLVPALLRIN